MNFIFSPPSATDLIRLLKAWRFWLLGAIVGALAGTAIYYLAPLPYRARATVTVDFNLEQSWPLETDRQQFYFLEREVRKLEEIAWSDIVLEMVSSRTKAATVNQLRDKFLQLSQPSEGGWHFYADAQFPEQAALLASNWAQAFAEAARQEIADDNGPTSLIEIEVTQSANLPTRRSMPMSNYMLAGATACLALSALVILVFPGLLREGAGLAKVNSGFARSR